MRGVSTSVAFERACRILSSYGAIGALFDPQISAQAVAKWGAAGVPPDRVIRIAAATNFEVLPHDLRPDIYPNPTDGVPAEFVVSEAFLKKLAQARAA